MAGAKGSCCWVEINLHSGILDSVQYGGPGVMRPQQRNAGGGPLDAQGLRKEQQAGLELQ